MPARSPNPYFQTVIRAADFLSRGLLAKASEQPRVAVILGSGLGEFADTLKNREALPFSAVPHFPVILRGRSFRKRGARQAWGCLGTLLAGKGALLRRT